MEKKSYIVAIDLGSSSVSIVAGSKRGEELRVEAVAAVPTQGVCRGEIVNIIHVSDAISKGIKSIEEKLGIRINDAYTGISGQHIQCAKYPYYIFVGGNGEIRDEDVRNLNDGMRNMQAPMGERILERMPQNYLIDNSDEEVSDPVGRFGQKLASTFNFVLGSNEPIDRLGMALRKIGLTQLKPYVNALASAEAVVLPEEKEEGVAILDIGAGTTDLCIYYNNIVRYVGVIPLGADVINKDIRHYGIPGEKIERLKCQFGCALPESAKTSIIEIPKHNGKIQISMRNLAVIIESRLLDIIKYVKEEIAESGWQDKLGLGIVITGGCANLKDIDKLFARETGMEVRIAAQSVVKSDDEDIAAALSNPALASAVGVFVRAAAAGKFNKVESFTPKGDNQVDTGVQDDEEEQNGPVGDDEGMEDEPAKTPGFGRKLKGFFSGLGRRAGELINVDEDVPFEDEDNKSKQ